MCKEISFEEKKLRYKIDKASRLFGSKGYKIEVNGNLFTLKEYLTPTVDLLIENLTIHNSSSKKDCFVRSHLRKNPKGSKKKYSRVKSYTKCSPK